MLRITTFMAEAIFLYLGSDLTKDNDYFITKDIQVLFEGETSKLLNLHGTQVTKELFRKIAYNIDPRVPGDITLTARNVANRKSAFDFCFSASKSVSVMHFATQDPAILKAHQFAVRKAMRFVEENAITQANTQKDRGYEHTDNIMLMVFDHFTSRPVEVKLEGRKFIPDCQIHSHAIVPNITWNPYKNRFQALEMGKTHDIAPYVEEVYHSHLSKELVKAGYAIRRTKDRYEIEGVSREIIDRFSNRTAQIEKIAKEQNITDPVEKAKLGAYSRASKAKAAKDLDLDKIWLDRLSKEELEKLRSLKGKSQKPNRTITAKEAVDLSLSHHLQRNSTAKEKMVLAHALKLGYGQLLPEDVSAELNSRENILKSEVDMVSHITTKELVYEENRMISLASEGKGKFKPLNPNYVPDVDYLNDQQLAAIHQILHSRNQTNILRGYAGVGKTSLLVQVKQAVEQTGMSFFGIASSAQASRGVMRQKGFDADTVAALLNNPQLQKEKLTNSCLLVDEAGTLGVKNMAEILALAKKYNTRLILSGDTRQHGPPGQYGDSLRILESKAKLETSTVQKIVRQKQTELKKAVERLSTGKTDQAYRILDKMGAIQQIPDRDKRLATIAEDYARSIKAKRSAMIISPTNAEGDAIAQVVRERLRQEKILQGKERHFETLKSLSLTEAQKKDAINYDLGHLVRFSKNQIGGLKAGSHYEIKTIDKKGNIMIKEPKSDKMFRLPVETPEYFELYEKRQTALSKGDIIRLTNNLKTIEKTKVNNGSNYQVKGFTRTGDIKLSNGNTLSKDAMHFKQGYVETSHSSQGKDCQDIYIEMSDKSIAAVNQQQFYVSVSRGIHSARIYTHDKEEMKRAAMRSADRMTAKEVAKGHQERLMREKQISHYQDLNQRQQDNGRTQRKQPTIELGLQAGSYGSGIDRS